jgi:RNA polymerase sigma factor (sigma-70 family)
VDDAPSRRQRTRRTNSPSFSARCNPFDPSAQDSYTPEVEKQGDRRYPESCNPNRTRLPLTEEQQGLATRYLPLARSLAKRMENAWPGAKDEFESAAFLALVQAAQSFDAAHKISFATFARHRIWGALRDLRRDLWSRGCRGNVADSRIPRFSRLGKDAEVHGMIIGGEPDEPVGTELENLDTVEHWIRQLPRPHALAFRHIYLDGKTQEETARLVGCSKSYLSRLHRQAMTWISQTYEFDRHD